MAWSITELRDDEAAEELEEDVEKEPNTSFWVLLTLDFRWRKVAELLLVFLEDNWSGTECVLRVTCRVLSLVSLDDGVVWFSFLGSLITELPRNTTCRTKII